MGKPIQPHKFKLGMAKKIRQGYSKQSAYRSMKGLAKKIENSRRDNSVEEYSTLAVLILMILAIIGAKIWITNLVIKLFSGFLIGIPTSAVAMRITNLLGLRFLKNYNYSWKFWKIEYGVSYYVVVTSIIEWVLF